MRLEDKVALVTGAARGIGRGFAEGFVREGAQVVIADINLEAARQAAAEIGSACSAVHMDVTKLDSIATAISEVVHRHRQIDNLINNAALFDLAPIVEITEAS